MKTISARQAIYQIRAVFGFNKNQIAKMTGCTRMLLSIQEGKNVISPELKELYDHSAKAKEKYGTDLANYHSNILVRKKTVKQHFLEKTPDIEAVLAEAYKRSKGVKVVRVKRDAMHMYLRTARLRRGG